MHVYLIIIHCRYISFDGINGFDGGFDGGVLGFDDGSGDGFDDVSGDVSNDDSNDSYDDDSNYDDDSGGDFDGDFNDRCDKYDNVYYHNVSDRAGDDYDGVTDIDFDGFEGFDGFDCIFDVFDGNFDRIDDGFNCSADYGFYFRFEEVFGDVFDNFD